MVKVNSIETSAQMNDAFLVVFKKHDAIMLLVDPNSGEILDANPAAENFYGYSYEQFRELNITDLNMLPPEEEVEQRRRAVEGRENQFVFLHRLANGEIRTVEVHSSPVRVMGRDVLFSIIIDKTEHKKAVDDLRASEQKFRTLASNIPSVIYQCLNDNKYTILYANYAIKDLTGYSPEEFINGDVTFYDLYHPEDLSIIAGPFHGRFRVTYRIYHKSGEIRWVDEWGTVKEDEDGGPGIIEGVLIDVTKYKKMENALRESEARYRALFDRVIDGVYRSTPEGRFVDFNPAMMKMLGYESRDEMLAMNITNELYFSPDERGRQNFDADQKKAGVYRLKHKDGSEVWVEDHDYYVYDDAGNIIYHEGIIRDVTERRQMEDVLRHRLAELEAIYRVSTALRAAQSFDEALPILLDMTLDALGTDTGSILLLHPESGEIQDTYFRGSTKEIKDFPVKAGMGIVEKVFVTGAPFRSDEYVRDTTPRSSSDNGSIPGGWGGACVPIRAGDEKVGVFFISVQLPHIITSEQMKLLQSLSEIAGATMHRTRLFDETARHAQEFRFLYETSNKLAEINDLDDLLETITIVAKKLLNASSSGMYLLDSFTNELVMTVDANSLVEKGSRLQMGEGMAGRVGQMRQPLRIEDYSQWEGRSPQLDGKPIHAVLEVPMLYGGELIGVLAVDEIGDSDRKYTEADEYLLSLLATQAAGVIRSTRLRQESLNRLENLQTLHTIDKAIASSLDLRITLNLLLNLIISQLKIDAADVLLYNHHEQSLRYAAGEGFRTGIVESTNIHLSDLFTGRAVMERRMLKVTDREEIFYNKPFYHFWVEERFVNYICIPLIVKGEIKGVLEIYSRSQLPKSKEWAEFLETLAGQAAIAVDNAQLFENVQQANMELAVAYEATIEGWSHALDLRDKETKGHTQRVTELTLELARAMKLKDVELQQIRRGALLHDIGKMGISDSILHKKGKLTPEEWEIMRTHPELALKMLQPIAYLKPSLDIPYCHHEKWDGSGYPRGLKGNLIPLFARIFAIADVWDAITSERPYRPQAWSKEDAIAYIKNESGKHFDPEIVEVFLKMIKNK